MTYGADRAVLDGIAAADEGRLVSHEDIEAKWERRAMPKLTVDEQIELIAQADEIRRNMFGLYERAFSDTKAKGADEATLSFLDAKVGEFFIGNDTTFGPLMRANLEGVQAFIEAYLPILRRSRLEGVFDPFGDPHGLQFR